MCIYLWIYVPVEARGGHWVLAAVVECSCEPLIWGWELHLGPCWKQLLCLTAEPCLQPLWSKFLKTVIFVVLVCVFTCMAVLVPVEASPGSGLCGCWDVSSGSSKCSWIFGLVAEKPLSKPGGELHQNLLSCLVNQHCAKTEALHRHTVQDQKPFFFKLK